MFFKKKKIKKGKCSVKHYKPSGESVHKKMMNIIEFSEYEHLKPQRCYSIWQCEECGVRAYMGYGHCMGPTTAGMIDKFIRYEIEVDELLERFRHMDYRFIVKHNLINPSF